MQTDKLVIIRSKRKTLTLGLDDQGTLVVKAPKHVTDEVINLFISKNQHWISNQQLKLSQLNFMTDVLFLGTKYPLEYDDSSENIMLFDANKFTLNADYKHKTKAIITNWYKKRSLAYFTAESNKLCNQYHFKIKTLKLTNAQTRWGSCTHDNKIILNWRLIMLPTDLIKYVLIHELAHTLEKNHSKSFWKIVADIYPTYKAANKLLKENNYLLSFH